MRRLLTGVVLSVVAAAAGVGLQATPAGAQTRPISIVSDVHIRPSPATSQAPLTTMPAGSTPTYICYVDGENEGGTTKWFYVSWNGVAGYYSSIADDVPIELQGDIEGNYGIPRCGTGTDINQGSYSGATVNPAPTAYDRQAAVNWALQHAQDMQPWLWSGCTWFVSQALWYGGLHQTAEWNGYDTHGGHIQTLPGTIDATVAPALVAYLVNQGLVTIIPLGPDRFAGNAVPEAQLGDVIAYDWQTSPTDPPSQGNGFAGISHLALVTNIAPGQYPEVSEWGTAWPGFSASYQRRGWTWSQNQSEWLQQEHPAESSDIGVTALLLHFNF